MKLASDNFEFKQPFLSIIGIIYNLFPIQDKLKTYKYPKLGSDQDLSVYGMFSFFKSVIQVNSLNKINL